MIQTIKTIDDTVVGIEILEQWQRLKVYSMSLDRYLRLEKMGLLKREVESSTEILLKATLHWLINENRLQKQQKTSNKRRSAIVITVSNKNVAKQLIASGLRFGGAVKKVEKFWEAGPGSVCMRCCGIGHERLGSCGNRPEKCIMCAGEHQISEHQCGVRGCSKGMGKLCVHVVARCANCQGNHQANSARCPLRQKAEIQARKNKVAKEDGPTVKATTTLGPSEEDEEIPAPSDQEMETEAEEWSKSPGKESSPELGVEDMDHTQKF